MRHLFYQNYKQLNGSIDPTESKSDVSDALTLHPFKNHTYIYGMQNYIQRQRLKELQMHYKNVRQEETELNESLQEIRRMQKQKFDAMKPDRNREDVAIWTAYSGQNVNTHKQIVPKHVIHNPELQSIIDVILETEKSIAEKLKKNDQQFYVKNFRYGYKNVNPLTGLDYIFNLKICCSGNKEDDNIGYFRLKRTFSELEFTEKLPNMDEQGHDIKMEVFTNANKSKYHEI